MGIIATATPSVKPVTCIPRDASATDEKIVPLGKIPIDYLKGSPSELSLAYEKLHDIKVVDCPRYLDLMWKVSWPLRSPRPGWSGFMQSVCKGEHPEAAAVTFLPMIDMDPNNINCVYSTLMFVVELAKKHNVTPVVTFDQPLWWKAQLVVNSLPSDDEVRSLVLRLGGFHTEMSFL